MANYLTGRYEAAIIAFKNRLEHFPTSSRSAPERLWMIASYMELGMEKEARSEAQSLLEQRPDFSIEAYIESTKRSLPFRDYAFLDHLIELLRKAGLK